MSIMFSNGLGVKTWGDGLVRIIGPKTNLNIPMQVFLRMAEYLLTNTDLEKDDPRPAFLERCRGAELKDGWNEGGKRYVLGEL